MKYNPKKIIKIISIIAIIVYTGQNINNSSYNDLSYNQQNNYTINYTNQYLEYIDDDNQLIKKTSIKDENSTKTTIIHNEYNNDDIFSKEENQKKYIILGIVSIILILFILIVKAKENLTNIIGIYENPNTSTENKTTSTQLKKQRLKNIPKSINHSINMLDNKYRDNIIISNISQTTNYNNQDVNTTNTNNKNIETPDIINIDELLKNKNITNQSEFTNDKIDDDTDDLEDFLMSFNNELDKEITNTEKNNITEISSDSYTITTLKENLYEYNTEYLEELLNKTYIRFSKEEYKKITNLINIEISSEATNLLKEKKANKFNPITKKTNKEVLEDLLLTYAIKQNILFKEEDTKILSQLVEFEIDKSFITDLKIKPKKKNINNQENIHNNKTNNNGITFLKVKNLLPNLEEEFKNKTLKDIKYERKKEVIYYLDNYEVNTLKVDINDLPNLNEALKKKEIENTNQENKNIVKTKTKVNVNKKKSNNEQKINTSEEVFIYQNLKYNVLNKYSFNSDKVCYFLKNDSKFLLIGTVGDRVIKIKEFENLKNSKFYVRLNQKINDNILRFLIRIEYKKIIIDVKDDDIEFVMEL